MGGLAKGLSILEAFSPSHPRMTVTEAARLSQTTPAAARRCLLTLADLGYLAHDGKYFRPTPRVLRLTMAYTTTSTLAELAQPCLKSVRDELDKAASLAVLSDGESLFIARAETPHIVSAGVRVGATLPLWASATGRILAGALPPDQLDEVLRQARITKTTPNTLSTRSQVRRAIVEARDRGVAYTNEELELGVRTMAVPVKDPSGSVVAAMSISAFAAQVSLEQMQTRFLPVLQREAARLARML
jgi:IclR family transcriptional regulator, pca regulon regulatory protein